MDAAPFRIERTGDAMKRVYCLYRVSTKGQIDKDDIPMQRQSCHEYVDEKPDWHIEKEFLEKGVSGFKVSAKDRDAIQDLQKAALAREFDILLVFMFDRIGRKDDETPFVVEWFTQQGIEVWSVKEGQQSFENHVDKLLNYIRFWQASGESIKTSVRTKTRMGQIVKEGCFKGGVAPYGYQLVHKGRINKRGHEVFDLEIDDREAFIVKQIFYLHSNCGMGPQTIATHLAAAGVKNRSGKNFVAPTIRNIVSNPMYRGVLRCGEAISEPFEHLRIIEDQIFFRSQELISQRSKKYQEQRRTPKKVANNCLLTGNIFCGHCGGRLITSTAGSKRKLADGTYYTRRWWRYLCYNRVRHKGECCGQTGYTAERIDKAVSDKVKSLLAVMRKVPVSAIMEKRYGIELASLEQELKEAQAALVKRTEDLDALKSEIASCLRGQSSFKPTMLGEAIEIAEKERDASEQAVRQLEESLANSEKIVAELKKQHDQLIGWDELFDSCDMHAKRLIICQLVDEIRVSRGYRIDLKLNVTMEQYLEFVDADTSVQQALTA